MIEALYNKLDRVEDGENKGHLIYSNDIQAFPRVKSDIILSETYSYYYSLK